MSFRGKRIADDPIYLSKNRYNRPKEIFKAVGKIIADMDTPGSTLLDVGCATGEFLYYIKRRLSHFGDFYGFDVSKKMIKKAREHVRGVKFSINSILNPKISSRYRCDVVTCMGVLSIFDNIERPLKNLLSCLQKNGLLVIVGIFNDDPIDVLMRYRRTNNQTCIWETGWNIFSVVTVESILKKTGHQLKWSWYPFRFPFPIKKMPQDPMRSWTVATSIDPHQQINGACQLLNFKILKIQKMD
jgi:SAM-dependent methyltransferase